MARWGEGGKSCPAQQGVACYFYPGTVGMHKFLLFQKLGGGGVESIVEEGVVTAGVLAGELDISRDHAARILNRLVERGLAERCVGWRRRLRQKGGG